jgi:hypothetical protein
VLALQVGPFIHPFISSYTQAATCATVLQILSLIAVWYLPCKGQVAGEKKADQHGRSMIASAIMTVWETIKEVFVLAVAAPPAAKVILFFRFGLSVSWPGHVCMALRGVLLPRADARGGRWASTSSLPS